MQEKILKAIKKEKISFPLMEAETVEHAIYSIHNHVNLNFTVTSLSATNNYWLQADYYSKKLEKVIIIDNDFQGYFETAKELANVLIATQKEARKTERSLTIKK